MYIDFDPTDEQSSLGKYLRAVREEKEISIEELAEITKIKQGFLEAIEEDKYDSLPQGPYLQLFLKSYSEALDLDYQKVSSYLETAAAQQAAKIARSKPVAQAKPVKETPAPKPPEPKPQTLKPVVDSYDKRQQPPQKAASDTKKYLGIIGAVVFLAFIIVIIVVIVTKRPHEEEMVPGKNGIDTVVTEPQAVDSASIGFNRFLSGFDSLTISIYPASQQAVTIIADNLPQEKLVSPEQLWSVAAHDSILLKFERPDSSRIYLNGYLLNNNSVNLAGENGFTFNRNNWINYVDTTKVEGQ